MVVVIKLRGGLRTSVTGPTFAVDEKDVGPTVVIVIDESATGAHGFGQIFFPERSVVVCEMNSSLSGDVAEGDLLGRTEDRR